MSHASVKCFVQPLCPDSRGRLEDERGVEGLLDAHGRLIVWLLVVTKGISSVAAWIGFYHWCSQGEQSSGI